MRRNEVREWIRSKKLDGEGKHVLTARLLAEKTGFVQRYCSILLEEFEIEGLLQHKMDHVIDTAGRAILHKIYWKR